MCPQVTGLERLTTGIKLSYTKLVILATVYRPEARVEVFEIIANVMQDISAHLFGVTRNKVQSMLTQKI